MTDTITLTGVVATPPRSLQTASGLSITSFRLASSQRRYDRTKGEWVEGETNWYTVTAFRQLADHVTASLTKGDRILVSGRLRIRSWENGDRSGTSVEVDADSLGHDLHWGTSVYTRVSRAAQTEGAQDPVHESTESSATQPSPTSDPLPTSAPSAGVPGAAASGGGGAAVWGGSLGSDGGAIPPDPAFAAASASLTGVPPLSPPSAPGPTVEEWHSGEPEAPF
jgi:single-strand DNA-binding protein